MKWQCMIAIASAFLAIAVAEPLQAQITVEKELRLSRLEGLVYDESGKPISEATVSIAQNGVPVQSVVTDKVGGFRIENIQGRCLLHVVSLHHDISTITGEEVILFTLSESPLFRETKKR